MTMTGKDVEFSNRKQTKVSYIIHTIKWFNRARDTFLLYFTNTDLKGSRTPRHGHLLEFHVNLKGPVTNYIVMTTSNDTRGRPNQTVSYRPNSYSIELYPERAPVSVCIILSPLPRLRYLSLSITSVSFHSYLCTYIAWTTALPLSVVSTRLTESELTFTLHRDLCTYIHLL